MAYDPHLLEEMRTALARRKGVVEKKMFGGYCWMLNGNMICGVEVGRFMFRVGKEQEAQALAQPGASPMDITADVIQRLDIKLQQFPIERERMENQPQSNGGPPPGAAAAATTRSSASLATCSTRSRIRASRRTASARRTLVATRRSPTRRRVW